MLKYTVFWLKSRFIGIGLAQRLHMLKVAGVHLKSKISILLSLGITTALLVSFQNCSDAQFDSVDPMVHKISSEDQLASRLEDSLIEGELVSDDSMNSDSESIDNSQDENLTEHCISWNNHKICANDKVPRKKDFYIKLCQEVSKSNKAVELDSGAELNGLRGRNILSGSEIKSITDKRGNLIVFANSKRSLSQEENTNILGLLENVRGVSILCNLNVEEANNVHGHTVIVGGDVGNINNIRGSFLVINGQVLGSKTDVKAVMNK